MPVVSVGHTLCFNTKSAPCKQQQHITTLLADRIKKPRRFTSSSISASKARISVPPAASAHPIVSVKRKISDTSITHTVLAVPDGTPNSPTISLVSGAPFEDQLNVPDNLTASNAIANDEPFVKRQKLSISSSDSTLSVTPSHKCNKPNECSMQAAPSTALKTYFAPTAMQAQKRKWRLARTTAKEREALRQKPSEKQAFVFVPDTLEVQLSSPRQSCSAINVPSDVSDIVSFRDDVTPLLASCVDEHISVSEKEALLGDCNMLPASYALLIDVLATMEEALVLLLNRSVPPTVENVRVNTTRNFTLRSLAQLACAAPECIAVVGPSVWPSLTEQSGSKRSDSLLIRLDDPDGPTKRTKDQLSPRPSVLGDGPARIRRIFLQNRLLDIVRKHHQAFVTKQADPKPQGALWHPNFVPDRDVPPLPAPPLCNEQSLQTTRLPSQQLSKVIKDSISIAQTTGSSAKSPTPPFKVNRATIQHVEGQSEGNTAPTDLLTRFRTREKERKFCAEQASKELEKNQGLLSKLPCTMDIINTLLRTEDRSAVGWRRLVCKVTDMHPCKWQKEDIEHQLDAITKLAAQWCCKVELQSSRGGHAFRVLSDTSFVKAREVVVATKSFLVA